MVMFGSLIATPALVRYLEQALLRLDQPLGIFAFPQTEHQFTQQIPIQTQSLSLVEMLAQGP